MTDRDFWLLIRQAFLLIIDAIERRFDISPRTAECRQRRMGDTGESDKK